MTYSDALMRAVQKEADRRLIFQATRWHSFWTTDSRASSAKKRKKEKKKKQESRKLLKRYDFCFF